MDENYNLSMRVQTLIQELDRVREIIEQIDPILGKRVRGDLYNEIENQKLDLIGLKQRIIGAENSMMKCWNDYQERKLKSEPLFKECLALVQGSLVRKSSLYGGVCSIADAILSDLEEKLSLSWGRFSILADEEFIDQMAMIIRVRFPEVSIWNLPMVVHEFGHFVGPKMEKKTAYSHYHPFEELLGRARRESEMSDAFLHEHFADHFATYVLGPSYAFACILLRFDPLVACVDHKYHPSDLKRVYWILEALQKMDEAEGGVQRYYSGIIKELKASWERNLAAAALAGSLEEILGDQTTRQLQALMKDFENAVGDKLSVVRYKAEDWLRAKKLSHALLEDSAGEMEDSLSIVDVLNAAWWRRVNLDAEDSKQVSLIGKRALELCYKIGGISP